MHLSISGQNGSSSELRLGRTVMQKTAEMFPLFQLLSFPTELEFLISLFFFWYFIFDIRKVLVKNQFPKIVIFELRGFDWKKLPKQLFINDSQWYLWTIIELISSIDRYVEDPDPCHPKNGVRTISIISISLLIE